MNIIINYANIASKRLYILKTIKLIVDELQSSPTFQDIVEHLKAHYNLKAEIHNHKEMFQNNDKNELFLLYLNDNDIKQFFQNHLNTDINIAIIPNKHCPSSMKNYGISKDIFEAIDDGFNNDLKTKIDLLLCNELIAFNRIVIGDMHGMNRFNLNEKSRFEKFKIFIRNIKNLKFKSYSITTSKEHKIQTAASGITILEHSIVSEKSAISDDFSFHDGKLNAFVLAPTSLISYLWYLISIFFYQKISILTLPKSLGFIKSSKLTIIADKPIDFAIDNSFVSSKEIVVEVLQDCLNIHLGRELLNKVKDENLVIQEKDTIKINTLPKGELNNILIDKKLPLFKKASDDDFKDMFVSLRNSAKFTSVFLTLMILSTLLATTGLFANSAPVIIGAMILAPLMAPIVSLSMGVIRYDKYLLNESIKTLTLGIAMAMLFSAIFTFFIPLHQITPEMQNRLNPNLLDLMVAIFSGIAGAYANSKDEVAKSLAGVAIAVALVPPLSVTGIGIGLWNFEVIYGSFLLFITNLVGITLAASLTFIVLGYSPIKKAKKGLFYTTIMMLFISVPLSLTFLNMIEQNNYLTKLESTKTVHINNTDIKLDILNLNVTNKVINVDLELSSNRSLSFDELKYIKNKLQKDIDKKIILNISSKIKI